MTWLMLGRSLASGLSICFKILTISELFRKMGCSNCYRFTCIFSSITFYELSLVVIPKGRSPVNMTNIVTPTLQTSHLQGCFSHLIISGAMQCRVPAKVKKDFKCSSSLVFIARASPKSASFMQFPFNKILDGLMSRCTIFLDSKQAQAEINCFENAIISETLTENRCFEMQESKVPSGQNSKKKQILLRVSSHPQNLTMLGWLSSFQELASSLTRWTRQSISSIMLEIYFLFISLHARM